VFNEPFQPTAFQAALLVLRLRQSREEEKVGSRATGTKQPGMTRFRISEATLRRLCGRPRLHPAFLTEVQDWLLRAGWVMFFTGRSFGIIELDSVESWTRLGSKRISNELAAIAKGEFDFTPLLKLADAEGPAEDD
jgi:hypothetical protein